MSGLTLAVGSKVVGAQAMNGEHPHDDTNTLRGMMGSLLGSLRFVELQLVAFVVVFSASGLVPVLDIAFPVFSSLYFVFLATFVFKTRHHPKEVFHASAMFQLYVVVGTIIGLFLPLAFVLGGFARGDQPAVRAATPHLFLLSAQVLSENIISSMDMFAAPVRAILAILYTGRRLFALCDWAKIAFFRTRPPPNPWLQDLAWLWFGRSLALANLIYYTVNFFFFLIPRFLPRAFYRHFKEQDERNATHAVDKDKKGL